MNRILATARAALDRATDEVITNHASESGRWLSLMATIEHNEDFTFPGAQVLIPSERAADVTTSSHTVGGIGNEAPAAFLAGASSVAA